MAFVLRYLGVLVLSPEVMAAINNSNNKYGYIKDCEDVRDKKRSFTCPLNIPAPGRWNLQSQFPAVYDQGKLGSCTSNAIAAVFEYTLIREGLCDFQPSRLFHYYNERDMEGTVLNDAGAQIRDGIKTLFTLGICPERMWPYDITQYTTKPPPECYTEALFDRSVVYSRVDQTLQQLSAAIRNKFPVVFGFTVYESFESAEVASSGVMPMPKEGESVLGGHCVVMVGYDDAAQVATCRNSWGPTWGLGGYFTMPYEFLLNSDFCTDFWIIQKVTESYIPKFGSSGVVCCD